MQSVRPSSSYEILLPANVSQRTNERVSSYWIQGEPVLLQASSYIRKAGDQITATERLRDRMARPPTSVWTVWEKRLNESPYVDEAIGETTDEGGTAWLHVYLVWPHLAVYVTISGPEAQVKDQNCWAYKAIVSLKLNVQ